MPLLKGKENVGRNIETEENAGKPRKQAIAIALHTERAKDGMVTQPSGGIPAGSRRTADDGSWSF